MQVVNTVCDALSCGEDLPNMKGTGTSADETKRTNKVVIVVRNVKDDGRWEEMKHIFWNGESVRLLKSFCFPLFPG